MFQQELLAQAYMMRGYFNQFIIVNKFQCLFQAHADWRAEHNIFVSSGGAHVCELFAF